MRSRLLLPAVVIAAVVAVDAQAPPPVTLDGYPTVGTPSTVALTSAGAEPRVALRYRVPAGTKTTMLMTTWMNMAMSMGETQMPASDVPVTKITADLIVTDVAANGDMTYELAFTSMSAEGLPGMDPGMVAMAEKAGAGITALKARATITDRGVNKAASFDLGKVTDPNLKQVLSGLSTSIESMSMPMPEEPVGVGATWDVRQAINSAGTVLFQRAEYQLLSIKDGIIELRATLTQTAPPQEVTNAALPSGATMKVQKISGAGTGTMRMRMDNLIPTGEVSVASNAAMLATFNGQSQPMTVDTKMKMTISSR